MSVQLLLTAQPTMFGTLRAAIVSVQLLLTAQPTTFGILQVANVYVKIQILVFSLATFGTRQFVSAYLNVKT